MNFLNSLSALALFTFGFVSICTAAGTYTVTRSSRRCPPGVTVGPPSALLSMWVAVHRLTSSGKVLGPYQRITPEQALLACAREAATMLGVEDRVGTLAPGRHADFIMLSEGPLEVDPMKIKGIQVLATVMNGRVSYMASTKGIYHH